MVKSRAAGPRRAKAPRIAGRREETHQESTHREDTQRIAEMIDHAAGAKTIADTLGEKFLSYMLAMVIQEMSHIDSRRANRHSAERRAKPAPPPPDS